MQVGGRIIAVDGREGGPAGQQISRKELMDKLVGYPGGSPCKEVRA